MNEKVHFHFLIRIKPDCLHTRRQIVVENIIKIESVQPHDNKLPISLCCIKVSEVFIAVILASETKK